MCDNRSLDSKNISQCDFCGLNEVWSGLTISDYPVIKRGNDANPNYCSKYFVLIIIIIILKFKIK